VRARTAGSATLTGTITINGDTRTFTSVVPVRVGAG
jgi:hypothetical protein